MKKYALLLSGIASATLFVGGCAKSPESAAMPTTMPTTMPTVKVDPTHVVMKDQPCYMTMPMADTKPCGMLKAGTKVLMLIPGINAQIETLDGSTLYTATDGLDAIPAK